MSEITIRPMIATDLDTSMGIFVDAFRNKFVALKKWPNEKVKALLTDVNLFDDLEGYYVATKNNKIVGMVQLKTFTLIRRR